MVIDHPRNRFNVKNSKINSAQKEQTQVTAITRRGHLLRGRVEFFDQYVIYMKIQAQPVIVYRHGLYDFLTGPE
jgi:RNA chaperone Hfq